MSQNSLPTTTLAVCQNYPSTLTEVPYIRDTPENERKPRQSSVNEEDHEKSVTLTRAEQLENLSDSCLSPSHRKARHLIDGLLREGVVHRKIMAILRRRFPEEYARTYRHWRKKIDNAPASGQWVGDCFKCFPIFVRELGWKPIGLHPYEIHRREVELGYLVTNCSWLDKPTNLKKRGKADEVRAYAKAHGVSVRTAYRHLDKQTELIDFERRDKLEQAKRFHRIFYEYLDVKHPGELGCIPTPSISMLNKIVFFRDQYGNGLNNEAVKVLISKWGTISADVIITFKVDIGSRPSMQSLLKHYPFINQIIGKYSAKQPKQRYAITYPRKP